MEDETADATNAALSDNNEDQSGDGAFGEYIAYIMGLVNPTGVGVRVFDRFVGQDDVPGQEEIDASVLPLQTGDVTADGIRKRRRDKSESEARVKSETIRTRRDRKTRLVNFAIGIANLFVPKWWFVSHEESGTYGVRDYFHLVWLARIGRVLSYWKMFVCAVILTLVCIRLLADVTYEPKTETIGSVANVHRPHDKARALNVTSPDVRSWLKRHQKNGTILPNRAFDDRYFSCAVYDEMRPTGAFVKNVTFDLLASDMTEACPNETCLCISSAHIGIPANVVLLNRNNDRDDNGTTISAQTLFMIDPVVVQRGDDTFDVVYGSDGSGAHYETRSALTIVEYRTDSGSFERRTFVMHSSACVEKCIEINTRYRVTPTL